MWATGETGSEQIGSAVDGEDALGQDRKTRFTALRLGLGHRTTSFFSGLITMEMSGSRQIQAAQDVVWRALNDPAVLQKCIPGCETLEKIDDANMKGVVALRMGPMALKFSGDVQLSNLKPPNSYRLTGSGKAGPAGFASGFADVTLAPKDGGTELSYKVESTVGGRMAQLGSRLIDATAAQLAGEFFDTFAAEVAPASVPSAAVASGSNSSAAAAKSGGSGMPAWMWGIAAIVLVAAVVYILKGMA